jgi:hypothetical protein
MKSVKGWVKPHTGSHYILVDRFHHKGLLCAIVKMKFDELEKSKIGKEWKKTLKNMIIAEYHNGYVELKESIYDYQDLGEFIKSVELAFSGNLPFFDKNIKFVGFDTNHAWNWKNPKSRTAEAVRKDVIRLADEMSKLNWKKIQPLVMARKL